jgi:predicted DNA-binding transcriptional regulator AlpA
VKEMENNVQVKEVMMLPDGRLDTKNAASYTGLSEKTLAMMRCEGNGPKYIKRGRVFYFRNDLDEWILSGRVSSTTQAVKGQ